ncbi:MAG: PrsW family glutamic-type intramembrane protease [Minisyncoccia bacterium]
MDPDIIFYALLGGIMPALVWLAFWLREDYRHPEPRALILKTFLLGMAAVGLVLPFQNVVDNWLPGFAFAAVLLWAIFEEIFKLGAAYVGGIHSRDDDEPVDQMIYMITAALGFAAMENTLFLLEPLAGGDPRQSLITGNLRFIGASLLHVVSSGIVGAALAFSFYKTKKERVHMVATGLVLAVVVHVTFNLSLINWNTYGAIFGFGLVWVGAIILLLAFERAKAIAREKKWDYN